MISMATHGLVYHCYTSENIPLAYLKYLENNSSRLFSIKTNVITRVLCNFDNHFLSSYFTKYWCAPQPQTIESTYQYTLWS